MFAEPDSSPFATKCKCYSQLFKTALQTQNTQPLVAAIAQTRGSADSMIMSSFHLSVLSKTIFFVKIIDECSFNILTKYIPAPPKSEMSTENCC